MAVLRPGRFTTGPAGTRKMLTSHAAPAAAVEDAFPMLIEMPLAKAGDQRRTGGWRRDSFASVQAALPARGIPQAGATYSPAQGIATGYAEVDA